jgi:hypothetical protein
MCCPLHLFPHVVMMVAVSCHHPHQVGEDDNTIHIMLDVALA